jgi:two-component sensor histidine kinase
MQAHMPGICGVFEKDLGFMRNQVANDFAEVQRNRALFLKNTSGRLNPFEVRAELQRLTTLATAMKTADDALAGTKASVEQLAAAHQALDQAFTKDTKTLASLINTLSVEAQRISCYYNSLQTNN